MAMQKQTDVTAVAQESDVKRLLELDTKPWYQKPNLRRLYFALVPAVLGVEMTSGYDGSILNGLQSVKPWLDCTFAFETLDILTIADWVQTSTTRKVHCLVSLPQHSVSALSLPFRSYLTSVVSFEVVLSNADMWLDD